MWSHYQPIGRRNNCPCVMLQAPQTDVGAVLLSELEADYLCVMLQAPQTAVVRVLLTATGMDYPCVVLQAGGPRPIRRLKNCSCVMVQAPQTVVVEVLLKETETDCSCVMLQAGGFWRQDGAGCRLSVLMASVGPLSVLLSGQLQAALMAWAATG